MTDPLALWVTPVATTGGVARHVLDVAGAGLPGYRLAVLCPEGRLAEDLRASGTAVLTGPFGPDARGNPLAAAAASAATLRHAIRTLRPAVVHSHLAYADIMSALVVRGAAVTATRRGRRNVPVPLLASTEHGIAGDAALYHGHPLRARAMARAHRCRLRRTDVKLAVSEATARTMARRWAGEGVVVVRNGHDRTGTATSGETHAAAPRVLSLARLSQEKGLYELLSAFAALRQVFPQATLTLAGEGPERQNLGAVVGELGLTDAVDFPGHVPAVHALATHDVVVQLSRWENCSYTLLDAAAAGLGVVATDVGGNREILPGRCLVSAQAADLPGAVARLIEAQYLKENRPVLKNTWPTVAQMSARITANYREAAA